MIAQVQRWHSAPIVVRLHEGGFFALVHHQVEPVHFAERFRLQHAGPLAVALHSFAVVVEVFVVLYEPSVIVSMVTNMLHGLSSVVHMEIFVPFELVSHTTEEAITITLHLTDFEPVLSQVRFEPVEVLLVLVLFELAFVLLHHLFLYSFFTLAELRLVVRLVFTLLGLSCAAALCRRLGLFTVSSHSRVN
jgi:hypothetical protein